MKVMFKNSFFGPDHTLYRKDEEHDVPAEWKDILPEGTIILDQPKKADLKQAKPSEENPKAAAKDSEDEVKKILEGKTK